MKASSNKNSSRGKKVDLTCNQCLSNLAKIYVASNPNASFASTLRYCVRVGWKCLNYEIVEYCKSDGRFYPIETKLSHPSVALTELVGIEKVPDMHGSDIDLLLVSGIWTKVRARESTFTDEATKQKWIVKTAYPNNQFRRSICIRINFSGLVSAWIEFNCPDNILTAYLKGGVATGGSPSRRMPDVPEESLESDLRFELEL